MGGVVKAVTGAVRGVAKSVRSVPGWVGGGGGGGGLLGCASRTISNVGKAVSNVVKNPLPVIETVALTAVGVPAPVAAATVSAANGGNVKQIATSAISAYAGSQVGQTAGSAAASATESQTFGRIASAAAGGSTTATLNALAQGKSLSDALSAGGKALVVAGITSGTIEGIKGTFSPSAPAPVEERSIGVGTETPTGERVVGDVSADAAAAQAAKPESLGIIPTESKLLSSALYPAVYTTLFGQSASPSVGSAQITPAPQPQKQTTPTQTTVAPGSQALAQALRIGDVGAPIFGTDKEKGKKAGWNVESLRYMGDTGEA